MERGSYSSERFSDFVDQVVGLLTHVKRIDEDGVIIEEDWSGGEFSFENHGFDIVNDAFEVDYDDRGTLVDVQGFKVNYGRVYVEVVNL